MQKAALSRKNFLKLGGIVLAGGVLAACVPDSLEKVEPVSSPVAIAEATSESIQIPTATQRVFPTPTQIPTQIAATTAATTTPIILPTDENSRPIDDDILTPSQKEHLAEAALKFVADSEEKAIQIARSLGYLKNDGHPASVCGPLAVAILREGGLISKYVDLHDFWLLNPRDGNNMKTLERTFPRDEFMWYKSTVSTAEFDFQAFPLKAGDFLYLYAGDPGSFEHMLTVSRVDEQGKAYSVTNFDTPEGYIIQEVLLYDPTQPGIGKFYDWTNRKNYRYGLTGFGGFDLWRFAKPVIEAGPGEEAMAEAIDSTISKYGGNWYVLIKEVSNPYLYARKIRQPVHPASTIKIPIAMIFLKWMEKQNPQGIGKALTFGYDGRSYEQLLKAMLVNSEEKATESILGALKQANVNLEKMLNEWGIETIDVFKRIASAHDMAILFEGLYGNFLTKESRDFILDALNIYTPGDDTRWGALRKNLPEGYHFYNKRGTITDGFLVVADWAIVECPTSMGKRTFILGAFAFQGEQKTIYEDLVKGLEEMARIFWDYVRSL